MGKSIYLDGASNTPLDSSVIKAMRPYLTHDWVGNSMSIHNYGVAANKAVANARESIARDLNVKENEVFFTSGATEGNNWVVKSAIFRYIMKKDTSRNTIVVSSTEHGSVLHSCEQAEQCGMKLIKVSPKSGSRLSVYDVSQYLSKKVALVCVMATNNETGANNEVDKIAKLCAEQGIPILVDCTQSFSYGGIYMDIGISYPDATFVTFSSHKLYGPTGCGCLIAKKPEWLEPMIIGGSQEQGLRGGTANVAGIVGTAEAIHSMSQCDLLKKYYNLFTYFLASMHKKCPKAFLNIVPSHYNILSVNFSKAFPYEIDSMADILSTYDIAVSAGSACDAQHNVAAGEFNGSHVLLDLGLTERDIRSTVRVSFTKYTTKKDIDAFFKAIKEICNG